MNSLRPYQEDDCKTVMAYKSYAIFSEQRTGKTPIAITAMVRRGVTKFIVVCPASAAYPWAEEIQRWGAIPAVVCMGTKLKKQKITESWNKGAIVISYDSLKSTKTHDGMIDILLNKHPEGVILDEAHRIKNRNSANARAAYVLSRLPYKLALTGTPAPNKPDEIWSILHFLWPKTFKSYWKFVQHFMYVNKRYTGTHTFTEVGNIIPTMQDEFIDLIARGAIQRKRKDVMRWLPDKEYQRILLPPTTEQLKYLQELQDYFETGNIVTQGVLDRLIRYRQICLSPSLVSLPCAHNPKTEWIQSYLQDYPDRSTILFSKFTSYIHELTEILTSTTFGVIVGSTSQKQRNQAIKDFQSGKIKLLLINIDAGKEALTLDKAEAIIFTDKFPPVGDIAQAEDRFVATTKDKADKAHIIYELVLKGTYDEQLYTLIEQRASSVDAINNFKAYMKGESIGQSNIQIRRR